MGWSWAWGGLGGRLGGLQPRRGRGSPLQPTPLALPTWEVISGVLGPLSTSQEGAWRSTRAQWPRQCEWRLPVSPAEYYSLKFFTLLYQTLLILFHFILTVHVAIVQSLFVSDPLRPDELQHARVHCPSLLPRVCSNSCPLSR